MEVSYRMIAAICSRAGCGQAIHVSNGRYPGGCNDRGGFVIECVSCKQTSYITVSNPDDASRVTSGGRVIETWDDDVVDRRTFLSERGLTTAHELTDNMLVIQSKEPDDPLFMLDDRAIYRCPDCSQELERAAYEKLSNALSAVNDVLSNHFNFYVKGRAATPDTIAVTIDVSCSCTSHKMTFHRAFSGVDPVVDDVLEFVLAGPADPAMLTDIDGVYSRDDCVGIFKKLLLRWRSRHQVVLLAVPFIGLDYPGREENRVDLWNMVLGYTDPSRTLLVTRRATYTGFVKAAKTQGIDIAALAKFNLLTPLLNELGQKGALFKQESHAKFYAAVGRDKTEVLTGSFNIHTGKYVENLLFKTYDTRAFFKRYLMPFGVVINPELLDAKREVLFIEIAGDQVISVDSRRQR